MVGRAWARMDSKMPHHSASSPSVLWKSRVRLRGLSTLQSLSQEESYVVVPHVPLTCTGTTSTRSWFTIRERGTGYTCRDQPLSFHVDRVFDVYEKRWAAACASDHPSRGVEGFGAPGLVCACWDNGTMGRHSNAACMIRAVTSVEVAARQTTL